MRSLSYFLKCSGFCFIPFYPLTVVAIKCLIICTAVCDDIYIICQCHVCECVVVVLSKLVIYFQVNNFECAQTSCSDRLYPIKYI